MIEISNLSKNYFNNPILKNINLTIEKGSITGFIGKGGAGKTTLLRCFNLLESPDAGEVKINNQNIASLNSSNLRFLRQKIGMVFQSFNLLYNRSVFDNIALPLELLNLPKTKIKEKVQKIASLVQLTEKLFDYPNNLSGGQKQRVAIARALILDAEILLCDEFTSALDPDTTLEILTLLVKINLQLGITIVLISHDMAVVREICDYIYVIEQGQVVEQGTVQEIFYNAKHEITKSLINTILARELPNALKARLISKATKQCQVMLRLIFGPDSSQKSVISELIIKFNIAVNIISGRLDHIRDATLGNLLISFDYELDLYQKILVFFETHNVHYELIGYLGKEK